MRGHGRIVHKASVGKLLQGLTNGRAEDICKLEGSWHDVIPPAHLTEKILHDKCEGGRQFDGFAEAWIDFQKTSK